MYLRSCFRAIYFNSIKVQLKQKLVFANDAGNLFQFHKGTIKTIYSLTT